MKQAFFFLLLFSQIIFAQNKQAIIQSGAYYFGSGISADAREARDHALAQLSSQIAVRVASSFESKIKEASGNLEEKVQSVLRTHSLATLKNVKEIRTAAPNGQIEVFCYLAKTEVATIFDERKMLIYDIYQKARQYEETANYAHALKLYYFSLLLINSLPDQTVMYRDINFTTALPECINRILQGAQFSVAEDRRISAQEREITVKISVLNRPAALLDFTFWDGINQVQVQGRDGLATFQLLGAAAGFKELKLNIKYAYYEARDEYQIIADLWDLVNRPVFDAGKSISLKKMSHVPAPAENTPRYDLDLKFEGNIPAAPKITRTTAQFLELISASDRTRIERQYSHDPFLRDKIMHYLLYNRPKPMDKTIEARVNKTSFGYELRRIRMLHRYPSIHKSSTEYLVLDFSEDGALIDINTSISENLYQHFVKQSEFGGDWNQRQQIIKFIEKYRTAYLTRDIQTVGLMFAEEALIIVGRKIIPKKMPENALQYRRLSKEPDYEYLRLSKKQYIKRLASIFTAQQDIFLDFGTFDIVKKSNAEHVYGVEMRQSYASTSYSDEGYLFLLVDFSERNPLIYVRAWQPNEWSDSALVRTANFRIYK